MDTTVSTPRRPAATAARSGSPAYQAYRLLQVGFVAAPILAGLDKFTNLLVDWSQYLAPFVGELVPANAFMMGVGVVEIVAGIGVAVRPRLFAYVVAAWLVGIILNLLATGYYDVALRDVGLVLGALALGRLSEHVASEHVASEHVASEHVASEHVAAVEAA